MMDEYEDVTVDGKYTIRWHADGTVEARRYDETWIPQVTAGSNMVRALAVAVKNLRTELERVTAERDEARSVVDFMVRKAASGTLDGYRELGDRAAKAEARAEAAERERDRAQADLGHARADATKMLLAMRERADRAEQERDRAFGIIAAVEQRVRDTLYTLKEDVERHPDDVDFGWTAWAINTYLTSILDALGKRRDGDDPA